MGINKSVEKPFCSAGFSSCCQYLWYGFLMLFFIFVMTALPGCGSQKEEETAPDFLLPLLQATRDARKAQTVEIEQMAALAEKLPQTSPLWPVAAFLEGEVLRLRNEQLLARQTFRKLAKWAEADPYGDAWGGSSLACVALWRWIEALNSEPNPDPNEATEVVEAAQTLMLTRLNRQMLSAPVLYSLPQLEEEIARGLAVLAWSVNNKMEGEQLFLDYLRLTTTSELGPVETKIKDQLLKDGIASADQITLFLGKRFYNLKRHEEAKYFLQEAQKSQNTQIRAEANLYLAYILSIRERGKTRIYPSEILRSVYEEAEDLQIAQEALFKRAVVLYREGAGRDVAEALKIYKLLIDQFPNGQRTDDALYEVARHYQYQGDLGQALKYFEQLRQFQGKNDWINLASFLPALSLYDRGHPDDIAEAIKLLQNLKESQPYGPLYLNALFWLGRMSSETGKAEEGNAYFKQVIAERPYDYYAIRSRIHLHSGNREACQTILPDPQTRQQLYDAYRSSTLAIAMTGNSPYHKRLQQALDTGLYEAAFHGADELRQRFISRRLEALSLSELDESGLTASISLLLALRQDALAAKDSPSTSENRMQIAGTIGHIAKDWQMVTGLTIASEEAYDKQMAVQRDKHYLATAYPLVFDKAIKEASAAYEVPPELLYSVMRRESLFYPTALSVSGALGLFQFMPNTFDSLDKKWNILSASGSDSKEVFLFDPQQSILLGARWFKDELFHNQDGNLLFALMEHNAGYPAVKEWKDSWEKTGKIQDVEYMLETARYGQTRIFVRKVLTDISIMQATGLLKTNSPE